MTAARAANLGDFARALRAAEVLDHEAVDVPGSVVLLPHGVRLASRFRAFVRARLEEARLHEHEYPFLVPTESFRPADQLFEYENALLHVGTDADFAAGTPRATLCPTGEAEIYAHWARRVSRRTDLPIQLFRCARYFRPASSGRHSGRSIFRQVEAADVFELHCAFAEEREQQAALEVCAAALQRIAADLHVPVLWSERPRQGNHDRIARRAFAADVPLPTGGTVQVATLYDQGQAFSTRYRVGWVSGGAFHPAHQLAGAVTRRLLFAHLALGLDAFGVPAVHPVLAPAEVVLVHRSGAEDDDSYVQELVSCLEERRLRVHVVRPASSREVTRAQRALRARGTPLELLTFGRRSPADELRVVLRTADGEEAAMTAAGAPMVAAEAAAAVERFGRLWAARAAATCAGRSARVASLDEVRGAVGRRLVAVVPAERGAGLPRALAGRSSGEVLGFVAGREPAPCVVTGVSTTERALVSARV